MSSLKDPWLTVGINAFLLDKHLVATRAAITEFSTRNIKHAGSSSPGSDPVRCRKPS